MTTTATAFGWRMAGLVAAFAGAVSLSALLWKRKDLSNALNGDSPNQAPHREKGGGVSLASLLKLRLTWFAFSFFLLSTLVFGALQNFSPSILRDLYGLSLAAGTSALTAYLIGGVAGLAAGGFLAGAAAGQEKLVGLCFLGSAVLAVVLGLSLVPGWAVIGIMAVMGFCIGIVGPSRDMLVRKSTKARVGTGAFGRIYGLVYSGLDVGLATAPLLFGVLMDAGKPHLVFAGISISLVLAIFVAQAIAREAHGTAQS
jgi:predicted MFS family arabinose efflux permease